MVARAVALAQARDFGVAFRGFGRLGQFDEFFARDPDAALDAFAGQSRAQCRSQLIGPERGLAERPGESLAESTQVLNVFLSLQKRFRGHGDQFPARGRAVESTGLYHIQSLVSSKG